jgi:hypothetical protein
LYLEYNRALVGEEANNFGQPKNFAVLQRDYAVRPSPADPWNLFFNFRFSAGGTGEQFDNRGLQTTGGLDISKQTAIAAGQAYYHRYHQWKEPPNFLNPFWRATLVVPDIDEAGKDTSRGQKLDAETTLERLGTGFALRAYRELARRGFKGWQ